MAPCTAGVIRGPRLGPVNPGCPQDPVASSCPEGDLRAIDQLSLLLAAPPHLRRGRGAKALLNVTHLCPRQRGKKRCPANSPRMPLQATQGSLGAVLCWFARADCKTGPLPHKLLEGCCVLLTWVEHVGPHYSTVGIEDTKNFVAMEVELHRLHGDLKNNLSTVHSP